MLLSVHLALFNNPTVEWWAAGRDDVLGPVKHRAVAPPILAIVPGLVFSDEPKLASLFIQLGEQAHRAAIVTKVFEEPLRHFLGLARRGPGFSRPGTWHFARSIVTVSKSNNGIATSTSPAGPSITPATISKSQAGQVGRGIVALCLARSIRFFGSSESATTKCTFRGGCSVCHRARHPMQRRGTRSVTLFKCVLQIKHTPSGRVTSSKNRFDHPSELGILGIVHTSSQVTGQRIEDEKPAVHERVESLQASKADLTGTWDRPSLSILSLDGHLRRRERNPCQVGTHRGQARHEGRFLAILRRHNHDSAKRRHTRYGPAIRSRG